MNDLLSLLWNDPVVFLWVVLIMAIIGNLCFAIWVYTDAKSRGVKKWLICLFSIFTVLSTGWWLFYLILRTSLTPKHQEVVCPQCHARIPNDVKFCPNCGAVHAHLEVIQPKKPKVYWLIAGIVLITIVLTLAFIDVFKNASSMHCSLSTKMSTTTK
jgi:hypothetical protein